jgi:hypothetical protein
MIKAKFRGLMKEKVCDDELDFIFMGIKQDIIRNRLYTATPKKTDFRYITRLAVMLHDIWLRSHNEISDVKLDENSCNRQIEIVVSSNLLSKNLNALQGHSGS